LTASVKVKFLKTIKALRQKSDIIYDPNQRFFDDDDDNDDDDDENHDQGHDSKNDSKKTKPKRFKDVIREQILEQMEEESGGATQQDSTNSRSKLAYNEQQDELRQAFLKESAKLDGGSRDGGCDDDTKQGDEWMVIKKQAKASSSKIAAMEQEANKELEELQKISKQQNDNSTFQDPRGEIQDGEQFLYDFIKNKKWIDKNDPMGEEGSNSDSNGSDNGDNDDEDSLEDIDKADEFESNYNFRFEQAAAETGASGALLSVKTYARGQTMNTLRREDSTRKEKRQARAERKAAERKAKEEQLKRLKNAKRQELNQKLAQVKSVIGAVEEGDIDEAAIMKMLEGDYDPEQFEKAMQDAYGDEFYEKEDAEWKSDLDVRKSLKEDEDGEELVGQDDINGDMYDTFDDGQEDEDAGTTDNSQNYDESEEWEDDGKEYQDDIQQEETELEKKLRAKMQDELYKLDYEDIVAGMPTRFKYREVEPNDYGLTTQEILFARDSALKQFVSLKKMAPYNDSGEYHVNSKKRRRFREQLKQDLEEQMAQEAKNQDAIKTQDEEIAEEEPKRKKRRRLKKGKKKGNGDGDGIEPPEATQNKEPVEKTGIPSETSENVAQEANQSSRERRRKKSGKKGTTSSKQETEGAEDKSAERCEQETISPIEPKIESNSSMDTSNKARKKNKKKKRKLVDRVSKTRLAAYGL
jgi:protein KRI1